MTGNFPQLLHAFFHEWLAGQRNNSCHTVRSYRDTWRLFLRFMAAQQQRPVAALRLDDLTASEVLAFLDHSEKERKVSIGTRNCRLGRYGASSASSQTGNRWLLGNARRYCGFPSRGGLAGSCVIWNLKK
jgi:Phage integrase, N-terminal SAM-like domain